MTQNLRILTTTALALCFLTPLAAQAFYNPTTGRWLNRDPLLETGFRIITPERPLAREDQTSPQQFVRNNPVSRIDRLGLNLKFDPRPGSDCSDPCKWARDYARDSQSHLTKKIAGITVCCGGKKYACVVDAGGLSGASNPAARSIISDCTQAHEDSHQKDPLIKCPERKCGWTGPQTSTFDTLEEHVDSECQAHNADLACLKAGKDRCRGEAQCEEQVESEIQEAQRLADYWCGLRRRR